MDKIRTVVVGCGGGRGVWFTEEVAKHEQYELVALADSIRPAAQAVARHIELPDTPVFATTEEALDNVAADAVVIATPDGEHIGAALAALSRGKRVYVEKPLAITLEDCVKIVEADSNAGRLTMVGFNLRFAPLYIKINGMIRDGAVGDVLTIQADEFYEGGKTYFRRWNRLRRCGGGLWITKASHDFDLLYWMANRLPVRVQAAARLTHYRPRPDAGQRCEQCSIEPECSDSALGGLANLSPLWQELVEIRKDHGWYPDLCLFNSDKDTFDHGMALVEFEGDVFATYSVDVVASFTDRHMRVSGTKGAVQGALSSNDLTVWKRSEPEQSRTVPLVEGEVEGGHGGGDLSLLNDFAAFVRGEPSRATSPAEASVAVAIGLAATRASDAGRPVSMEELDGWRDLLRCLP